MLTIAAGGCDVRPPGLGLGAGDGECLWGVCEPSVRGASAPFVMKDGVVYKSAQGCEDAALIDSACGAAQRLRALVEREVVDASLG